MDTEKHEANIQCIMMAKRCLGTERSCWNSSATAHLCFCCHRARLGPGEKEGEWPRQQQDEFCTVTWPPMPVSLNKQLLRFWRKEEIPGLNRRGSHLGHCGAGNKYPQICSKSETRVFPYWQMSILTTQPGLWLSEKGMKRHSDNFIQKFIQMYVTNTAVQLDLPSVHTPCIKVKEDDTANTL